MGRHNRGQKRASNQRGNGRFERKKLTPEVIIIVDELPLFEYLSIESDSDDSDVEASEVDLEVFQSLFKKTVDTWNRMGRGGKGDSRTSIYYKQLVQWKCDAEAKLCHKVTEYFKPTNIATTADDVVVMGSDEADDLDEEGIRCCYCPIGVE